MIVDLTLYKHLTDIISGSLLQKSLLRTTKRSTEQSELKLGNNSKNIGYIFRVFYMWATRKYPSLADSLPSSVSILFDKKRVKNSIQEGEVEVDLQIFSCTLPASERFQSKSVIILQFWKIEMQLKGQENSTFLGHKMCTKKKYFKYGHNWNLVDFSVNDKQKKIQKNIPNIWT